MAHLVRERLRQRDERRLRRVVDRFGGLVLERVRARDVHDGARRAPVDPVAAGFLHREHRRPHVHREGRVELAGADVERGAVGLQAGVVHEHVDAAEEPRSPRRRRRAVRRSCRGPRRGSPADRRGRWPLASRVESVGEHVGREHRARPRRGRHRRCRARCRGRRPSRSPVVLRTASSSLLPHRRPRPASRARGHERDRRIARWPRRRARCPGPGPPGGGTIPSRPVRIGVRTPCSNGSGGTACSK